MKLKNYLPHLIGSIATTRLHDTDSDKDYGGVCFTAPKIKDLSAAERVLSCFEMFPCVRACVCATL